jgi:uncharacterized protein YndB with AHSA1/START domain
MMLPHRLDRTVLIHARRDTVFSYFMDSARWASWWGTGSSIDARPGGRMLIRHPNGVEASGEVVDVAPPERIVFTYGYEKGKPAPPGSSRVTIRLDAHPDGTLLTLTHEFADSDARDEHVQGWRFQLSLFANAVANAANARVADTIDRWFETWNELDAGRRASGLSRLASPRVQFADRYSHLDGLDDLTAHLDAVHRFMPGLRIVRRGDVRHCQWSVLADWSALAQDDAERGQGTSLFVLDADGLIRSVTGFPSQTNG